MKKEIEAEMAVSPRDRIYSTIVQNPGLHFREIQRRVGYATGAMQYHIDYLKKKNFVYEKKEGKFSRFYAHAGEKVDPTLMSLLRQEQVRKIVLFLLNKRRATIQIITKEVGLSTSTINFHLKKLVDSGVVVEQKSSGKTFFGILNKEPIMEMLIVYRKSFLDVLVDNFVNLWEKDLAEEFGKKK